ncbi:MAG TPA: hypothetical protein VMI54_29765, partial [Polyangiaceae bacterium]|nr:hypothetical protein [Polyangiaceae bacterium]
RLDRLETAVVHITDVLVLQSERMDAGFRSMREETQAMHRALSDRLDAVTDRLDAVTDRLDRLISVTMQERTLGIERLAKIESRLARLEEHVGI